MIRSMTAFTRQERSGDWGAIAVELRSVNHRYLDMSMRLPDELRALEPKLREAIQARLGRGKVDCTIRFEAPRASAGELVVDKDLAKQLAHASREVDALLYSPAPVSSLDVLRWPGVLQAAPTDWERLHAEALGVLGEALTDLVSAREREGAKLRELIELRCQALSDVVQAVRAELPDIRARWREKLLARLAEIQAEADPARLEQEMVYLAQRMDVDEEIDRLEAHVAEVRRVLDVKEPVGRRLDFLMQELNREANTLGSKSVDASSTRASVDLKVLIEQMREQVQNIE
ncbi:MAG: hypothetical protein AMJ69_01585 [Gammaproteobacteria bacterium SG8_47]|nr:MAG: hypothetical protein AMJ69_01585 [Gammaproteobacteria bacterium SG8_47]